MKTLSYYKYVHGGIIQFTFDFLGVPHKILSRFNYKKIVASKTYPYTNYILSSKIYNSINKPRSILYLQKYMHDVSTYFIFKQLHYRLIIHSDNNLIFVIFVFLLFTSKLYRMIDLLLNRCLLISIPLTEIHT